MNKASASRLRKFAWGLAGLCVSGAIFLVAAEAAVRLLLPQYAMAGLVEKFDMGPSSDERFRPSGTIGWEHAATPDTPVDARGFLSVHAADAPKGRDETRLLLIGDSIGEGLVRVTDLPLWEQFLSQAWHKKVKFWTFAVGGYRIQHYDRVLRFKADYVRPDVVLINFSLLDPYSYAPVVLLQKNKLFILRNLEFSEKSTVSPFLFVHSQLYRFLWLAYVRGRQSTTDFKQAGDAPFADIVSWCRERHVKVYAVIWPVFTPPERYTPTLRLGRKAINDWLTANRIPFLDLHEAFPAGYWRLYRNAGPDDVHPNPEGYREATRLIWKFLAREK